MDDDNDAENGRKDTLGEPTYAPAARKGWRRWAAIAVACLGIGVVGSRLASQWPRQVSAEYLVDSGTKSLDIDVVQDEIAVMSSRFTLDGTQNSVAHQLKLAPGRYEVIAVTRSEESEPTTTVRTLVVPSEGATRIDFRR